MCDNLCHWFPYIWLKLCTLVSKMLHTLDEPNYWLGAKTKKWDEFVSMQHKGAKRICPVANRFSLMISGWKVNQTNLHTHSKEAR